MAVLLQPVENAFNEVKRKFWVYDRMKTYAETHA